MRVAVAADFMTSLDNRRIRLERRSATQPKIETLPWLPSLREDRGRGGLPVRPARAAPPIPFAEQTPELQWGGSILVRRCLGHSRCDDFAATALAFPSHALAAEAFGCGASQHHSTRVQGGNTPRTAESTIRCHVRHVSSALLCVSTAVSNSSIFDDYSVLVPAGCREFPDLRTPLNYRKLLTL